MQQQDTLIVITGPTGVGKTATAIEVAKRVDAEIISADSRQIFKEIPIGTAAPSAEELHQVTHHFVAIKNLDEYFSAAQFEQETMELLPRLFGRSSQRCAVMCGGRVPWHRPHAHHHSRSEGARVGHVPRLRH